MKKIIPLLFFILTSSVYAQNSGITYQAVIYNPSTEILPGNNNPNVVLAEKDICLRFSISDSNSSIEFQEVQKVKTDEFGMVNLIVGDGDQVSGYAANFDAIIWNSSNKYLKVEIDASGNCTNFIEISNQKFASVPFAFASKVAESVSGIVPIVNGGTGANTVAGAKTNLGLNNVDNTSDLNKPISTATQTALDAKAPLASPGFTGVPTAPTAAAGTNTTQIATTAFVSVALATAAAPDATTTLKGRIQLAGDLSGTAEAPTVPGLAIKENSANKSTNISLGNSDILFPTQKAVKTYVDNQVSSGVVDATTSVKGKLKLAGDLGGTADLPTVPGLANKENTIATGTTSQYWRGDKTWQTLDKSVIGLGNVDNTSDANKPVSIAVQTALNGKEDSVNKSTTTTLGTSDVLFPTQKAVKTYVDTQISANVSPDATSTVKGKIQLAGDLAGANSSAINPVISDNAISTNKITNSAVTTLKLADNAITNAKIGEVIRLENGGTGSNMATTAGYVKQASIGANFSTVSTIPVTDVTGAVRSVNGVVPASDGNVAVIIGRVFTGATVDPNLATSIINASPAKQQSDIYIVADGSNPNNGRTFIYDGTTWLEVATNLSTTDARYVNVAGDTMEGNLIVPTGKKILLTDAPTGSTDATNKAYVDNLINSSATPDATTSIKGKIKLAGDLGGTANAPTVPDLALKAPLASPSLTGTPLAPTAAPGTNTTQIATTAFVTAATTGKQDAITLTTTGTGAASLVGSTLNIPTPNNGTVTEISALTIGTLGTDITSTVANATTTPVITLNVPSASAANRGALSAADWTTFNNKFGGSGTTNFVSKFTGSSSLGDSSIFDDGTHVGIGNATPSRNLDVVNRLSTHKGIVEAEGPVSDSYSRAITIRMRREAADTPAAILTNDVSAFAFAGFDGTAFSTTAAGLAGLARENWTSSNKGMALTLSTTQNATTVLQERMRIDHNGNVGIATTTPISLLTNAPFGTNFIGSNSAVQSTTGIAWLTNNAGYNTSLYNANNVVGSNGLQVKVANTSNQTIAFEVGQNTSQTGISNPYFNVLGNGNIGIGTNAPLSRLIVNDNTYIANIPTTTANLMDNTTFRPLTRFQATSGINNFAISHYLTTTVAATQAHNYTLGTTLPYVLQPAGGNVGIGTTNPRNNLDVVGGFNLRNVVGAAGTNFGIEFNTNSSSPRIDWVYNGNYTGSFAGDPDNFFRLQTSRQGLGGFRFMTNPNGTSAERLTILNNGNIGIGTSTISPPTAQLHTTGSVRFEGAGTPATNRVLTSDASGNATWQSAPGSTSVTTRTANYTLTLSDNAGFILVNSTGVIDITIPATLPAGFYCQIIQQGTGQVRIVSPGVTMNSALGFFTRAQGSSIGIMMATHTLGFVSGDTGL